MIQGRNALVFGGDFNYGDKQVAGNRSLGGSLVERLEMLRQLGTGEFIGHYGDAETCQSRLDGFFTRPVRVATVEEIVVVDVQIERTFIDHGPGIVQFRPGQVH